MPGPEILRARHRSFQRKAGSDRRGYLHPGGSDRPAST